MMQDPNASVTVLSKTVLGRYKHVSNALILMFFLSGMCGLIYEVVWQKMLELVFGISTYSTTIILASFMGGLLWEAISLANLLIGSANP